MTAPAIQVLIDDPSLRQRVVEALEFVGVRTQAVSSGEELGDDAIVVTDGAAAGALAGATILVTGPDGRAPKGVQATATLAWPLKLNDVLAALHSASRVKGQRNFDWPDHDRGELRFERLVGDSAPMQRLRESMGKVAGRDVTVLLTGEPGTGKEVVARSLHESSHRSGGPFVPVNCGAIPLELLESELFGYERGAFAGAVSSKPGRFELADGGTLLLDEVAELPMAMQVKLLRVLQERCFERVGGSATIRCNARVIAATHRNLESMIASGEFREDLFYRLNVFPIHIPPLRDRIEDIPALVTALCAEIEARQGDLVRLDASALNALAAHSWPGNVRELANLLERLAIAKAGEVVGADDLKIRTSRPDTTVATHPGDREDEVDGLLDPDALPLLPVNGLDLKDYLGRLEKSLIQQALEDTNAVVARAADRLHIRRTTLVEKMRKYGLSRSESV